MTTGDEKDRACPYPFSELTGLNLDPHYREERDRDGLSRVRLPFGDEAWMCTRYEDVLAVLTDARFSRAATLHRDEPRVGPELVDRGLLSMDPPDHTRLRRVANAGFTPRQAERLRPLTRRVVADLLDRIAEDRRPPLDLISEFIAPMAVTVICELLGVPVADRADFQMWSQAIVSTTNLSPDEMDDRLTHLHDYMARLVEARRREPADGLLNAMIDARDEDPDRLTERELVLVAVRMLAPGVQNTVVSLSNQLVVLFRHQEALERLRARPELVPAAVEELIRYTPFHTSTMFPRYATDDVEIGGTRIRAGDAVVGSLCAANRDPRMFDTPDELDFERRGQPHLGFGKGAHFCPGAHLARMQLQESLTALVGRVDGLRLAVPEDALRWKPGMFVRWLEELPVGWSVIHPSPVPAKEHV